MTQKTKRTEKSVYEFYLGQLVRFKSQEEGFKLSKWGFVENISIRSNIIRTVTEDGQHFEVPTEDVEALTNNALEERDTKDLGFKPHYLLKYKNCNGYSIRTSRSDESLNAKLLKGISHGMVSCDLLQINHPCKPDQHIFLRADWYDFKNCSECEIDAEQDKCKPYTEFKIGDKVRFVVDQDPTLDLSRTLTRIETGVIQQLYLFNEDPNKHWATVLGNSGDIFLPNLKELTKVVSELPDAVTDTLLNFSFNTKCDPCESECKPTNPKQELGDTKLPLHLIPTSVLDDLSLALFEGASKYGRENYLDAGVRYSTYYSATLRHLFAWWRGEDTDYDSGLSHLTKAIASLTVLKAAINSCPEKNTDDRSKECNERAIFGTASLEALRNKIEVKNG